MHAGSVAIAASGALNKAFSSHALADYTLKDQVASPSDFPKYQAMPSCECTFFHQRSRMERTGAGSRGGVERVGVICLRWLEGGSGRGLG